MSAAGWRPLPLAVMTAETGARRRMRKAAGEASGQDCGADEATPVTRKVLLPAVLKVWRC